MKTENKKRSYKKVAVQDNRPLAFSYHHLPLIQKILSFKDSELAIVVGLPARKLRRTMELVEDLPERINSGLNGLLKERFNTTNICWIALYSWVTDAWSNPVVISKDKEFSCSYVHPETDFEISCESGDGFHVSLKSEGTTLKGIYGFDQANQFFNLLDKMVALHESEWVAFWEKSHEPAEVETTDDNQEPKEAVPEAVVLTPAQEKEIRHKKELAEAVAAIEKEAHLGGADAKYSAGVALAKGFGMDKPDLENAAYWLALAAADGHFQASKLLVQVKRMVHEQRK